MIKTRKSKNSTKKRITKKKGGLGPPPPRDPFDDLLDNLAMRNTGDDYDDDDIPGTFSIIGGSLFFVGFITALVVGSIQK